MYYLTENMNEIFQVLQSKKYLVYKLIDIHSVTCKLLFLPYI